MEAKPLQASRSGGGAPHPPVEVEVCLHDDDTEDMMYDLELRWPDGHTEAMEVTTDTAPERLQFYDGIKRHGTFDATESKRDWFIWLGTSTTRVRRVRAKIDPYLSLVEQEGLTSFSARQQHTSKAVATVRRDLGVNLAISREPAHEQPKIVLVGPSSHGWWEKPEAVNHAVERHASANAEKLARSGHDERHLFVLIETISFEASSALVSRKLPEDPPQLPEAITTVWAAGYGVDEAPVVWRVRRTGRWEVLL